MYEQERETVLSNVSMRDIAEKIGLAVNRSGYAKCPFHDEKTASLRLYDGKDGWYCFGCHAGGDVINFVMRYYGLKYRDALVWLSNAFCLRFSSPVHSSRLEAEKSKRSGFLLERTRKRKANALRDINGRYAEACIRRHRLMRWKLDMKPFSMLWTYAVQELPLVEIELDEMYEEMIALERSR